MSILKFRPAVLVEKSECYIQYSVRHPESGKMVRVRNRFNSIKNKKERKRQAKTVIEEINAKLHRGWNPFKEKTNNELFASLWVSFEKAVNHKKRLSAENSQSIHNTRLNAFRCWLELQNKTEILCSQFHSMHAMDFMEWLLESRDFSEKTFNNYLIDYRAIFNHLKKRGNFEVNPFLAVDRLRVAEVKKEAFTYEDQKRYAAYLKKNDYDFYICQSLVYYCALRNGAIAKLRVGDINANGFLSVSGFANKTDRWEMKQLPEVFLNELLDYTAGAPKDWFLMGQGLRPSPITTKWISRNMSDRFNKYKKLLCLPERVTFYSLKDTAGDRLLENNFNPKQVRDFMGHANLAMTDRYIKKRAGVRDERLFTEFPEF